MDYSIIIVSWNVKALLRKCLASIYKNDEKLKIEIFVVDNASQDDSAEMVKKEFPDVKLITNQQNIGFARANNLALKQAAGKYLLVLNPDTEILPGTFTSMSKFMDEHPNCGVAGCKHINLDKSLQPSVRRFPTTWSQLLILYKLHHVFPKLKTFRRYFAHDFDYGHSQKVDQVQGSFFLLRDSCYKQLGGFDEGFFIWFEEVDYCKRVSLAHLETWYCAQTSVVHHGASSFAQLLSTKRQRIFNKSLRYYFKKHHNWLSWFIITTAHLDSMMLSWLQTKFKNEN